MRAWFRNGTFETDLFTPGRSACLLALLVVVAFPDVILGQATFFYRDFGVFGYPLAYYHRECFWRGEIPLWNPYSSCGLPFLAQWNTLVCYPPTLIYLLLPLSWSLGLFCLLHLFWGGWGMYSLARAWTGHSLGAVLAGVAYAFSGLTLNSLMWPSIIAGLAWMPWVVNWGERAWREGGRAWALGTLAAAMQMLSGAAEIILLTWLILGCLILGSIVRGSGHSLTWLFRFLGMALAVAGLAAVQLIPFLNLLAHSQRGPQFAGSDWAMPVWGWANFFVPWLHCYATAQGSFFQQGQQWTSSYYAGAGIMVLSLYAVGCVRNRRVRLLATLIGTSLLLSMGDQTWLYSGLVSVLPTVGLMRYPVKFVVLAVFLAPLLAAFAVRHLDSSEAVRVRRHLVILAVAGITLVGLILWWAFKHPLPHDNWNATLNSGLSRALFLGLILGSIAVLTSSVRATRRPWLAVILVALVWMDNYTHAPKLAPTVDPWVYEPGLARRELRLDPEPRLGVSRVLLSREAEIKIKHAALADPEEYCSLSRLGLFENCNLLDGLPKIHGFFPLYLRESDTVLSLFAQTNVTFPRLADFLGAAQVTTPGKLMSWSPRPSFLPLITAGQEPVFLPEDQLLPSLLAPAFDPERVVLLPKSTDNLAPVLRVRDVQLSEARFEAHEVALTVSTPAPCVVVIAQSYHPNWRAAVDRQPVPVLRANYGFQAVIVPAGNHELRLRYVDWSFRVGAAISGATLLGVLAGFVARFSTALALLSSKPHSYVPRRCSSASDRSMCRSPRNAIRDPPPAGVRRAPNA
jgi:hypothetical protein